MKGEPRPDGVTVRRLGPGDDADVLAAALLFDSPPVASYVSRFLDEPTHHILLAYKGGEPGMWVLADEDDLAALATYRSAGATREDASTSFTWEWDN